MYAVKSKTPVMITMRGIKLDVFNRFPTPIVRAFEKKKTVAKSMLLFLVLKKIIIVIIPKNKLTYS